MKDKKDQRYRRDVEPNLIVAIETVGLEMDGSGKPMFELSLRLLNSKQPIRVHLVSDQPNLKNFSTTHFLMEEGQCLRLNLPTTALRVSY